MTPHSFPAGTHFLAFDPDDGDWALWLKRLGCFRPRIGWDGGIRSDQATQMSVWPDGWTRMRLYPITPEQVAACEMFAHHNNRGSEAWYRFAARMVERETTS